MGIPLQAWFAHRAAFRKHTQRVATKERAHQEHRSARRVPSMVFSTIRANGRTCSICDLASHLTPAHLGRRWPCKQEACQPARRIIERRGKEGPADSAKPTNSGISKPLADTGQVVFRVPKNHRGPVDRSNLSHSSCQLVVLSLRHVLPPPRTSRRRATGGEQQGLADKSVGLPRQIVALAASVEARSSSYGNVCRVVVCLR